MGGHVIFIQNNELQFATTLFPSFLWKLIETFLRRSTYIDSMSYIFIFIFRGDTHDHIPLFRSLAFPPQ